MNSEDIKLEVQRQLQELLASNNGSIYKDTKHIKSNKLNVGIILPTIIGFFIYFILNYVTNIIPFPDKNVTWIYKGTVMSLLIGISAGALGILIILKLFRIRIHITAIYGLLTLFVILFYADGIARNISIMKYWVDQNNSGGITGIPYTIMRYNAIKLITNILLLTCGILSISGLITKELVKENLQNKGDKDKLKKVKNFDLLCYSPMLFAGFVYFLADFILNILPVSKDVTKVSGITILSFLCLLTYSCGAILFVLRQCKIKIHMSIIISFVALLSILFLAQFIVLEMDWLKEISKAYGNSTDTTINLETRKLIDYYKNIAYIEIFSLFILMAGLIFSCICKIVESIKNNNNSSKMANITESIAQQISNNQEPENSDNQ